MTNLNFRMLTADDIECRPATIKESGLSLLLYKDARCDMSILDETVGATNWQRNHELINGNLFCNVGINVAPDGEEPCWVWKQDVGTESMTEKEKGEASDSFKRACFCWGIGRELYTAPFIWITSKVCRIAANDKGKYICKDTFSVDSITYKDKKIDSLVIVNDYSGEVVYELYPDGKLTDAMVKSLANLAKETDMNLDRFMMQKGIDSLYQLSFSDYKKTMKQLKAKKATACNAQAK